MPFLEHDGVTRELTAGETMVGAGSQAGWRLQTINLAPRHFTVSVGSDGQAVLSPYGTQPVEVNGTQLTGAHPLEHGDEIIAGAGIFVYLARLDAPGPRISIPVPVQTETSEPPAIPSPALSPIPVPNPQSPVPSPQSPVPSPESPVPSPTPVPSAAARAYLVDLSASLAYPLGDDIVGIGRDAVNHIVLKDAATSRFHADVRRAPTGAYVFRSMGTNGSTLNDTPAGRTPRALADGDTIRIGGSSLRFTTKPPPGTRIVAPRDVAPGPRAPQPTPIYRADEPNTVPPPLEPRATRGRLMAITAAILVAVVVLVALWMLRGPPHR